MKIAVFNGLDCHYEMYGYIIDYCYNNKYELHIYNTYINEMGWIDFYKKKYPDYLKLFHTQYFNIVNDYDKIILITDDDPFFLDSWLKYIDHKVICIDHYKDKRRFNISKHINVRYFPNRSTDDWVLPVFRLIDIEDKKRISKNNVILLGKNVDSFDIKKIVDYEKYNFILCARKIERKFVEFKNVTCYEEISTEDMIDFLKISDYVLVTDTNDHIAKSMSGCIPLALDCLCTLVMSEKMAKYYNLNSVITFNDDKIKLTNVNYKKVDNDLKNYISKRDEIFDRYLFNKNTAVICEPRNLKILPIIIKQFQCILKDWHFVLFCGKNLKKQWSKVLKNIDIKELDDTNFTPQQYNNFFKKRILWETLYGEYVLVFQTDTWIHEDNKYNIEYFMNLNKSYIGGNMIYNWNELTRDFIFPEVRNFNGGLSLRKRKDMIKILSNFKVELNVKDSQKHSTDAEDVYFVIGCYKLGLPVGDDEESSHFAIHTLYKDKWFGLHQPLEHIKNNLLKDYPETKVFFQ